MLNHTKKKKDTLHLRAKEKSHKMVGWVKLLLESNFRTARDAWRTQTNPCAHQEWGKAVTPTWDWVRSAFECLSVSAEARVSSDLNQGQGLWLQQTWEARHVPHILLEEVAISATTEPPIHHPQTGEQLYHRSSRNVAKVLGPTTDFLTWGSSKRA